MREKALPVDHICDNLFYEMNSSLDAIDLELRGLRLQRDALDKKIAALEQARELVAPFYQSPTPGEQLMQILRTADAGVADVGITDSVRGAFRMNAHQKLTARQVRGIVASRFDVSRYKNSMATIHQVINRLLGSGELDAFDEGPEKTFMWAGRQRTTTLAELAGTVPQKAPRE